MVMVGYRQAAGKTYFLLQNWWKQKQFVEMDEDYFIRCNSTVRFVETPQHEIPATFPQNVGACLAKCANLDKGETYRMGERASA